MSDNIILNDKEAAKYLGLSESFLRQCRSVGNRQGIAKGPRYLKLGRAVRYKLSDLEEWIEENRV